MSRRLILALIIANEIRGLIVALTVARALGWIH
jgi:hypothetical protein